MIYPNLDFEKSLLPSGCRYLLGIDEVGRGPLAGPVTIGAFLLDLDNFTPDDFIKLKVRDSKKLSPFQRQKICRYFQQNNYSFSTFSASSHDIDTQGIAICLNKLIIQALTFYQSQFDYCLIDGNYEIDHPQVISIIKGDQKCFSIAAASIIAKETRDSEMSKMHNLYPQYDFVNNSGYGTASHISAIKKYGPCPIHRRSFKPVLESPSCQRGI